METGPITIETVVKAPIEKVWEYYNAPEHITQWAFASDDWEATNAVNDLRVGGRFSTTMGAKDKSQSFEFGGTYSTVDEHALIEYDMDDTRHVSVAFTETTEGVKVTISFDPEKENSRDFQKAGWQAILNNFKRHTETN
jgi:uncharacterized protein YndB with AHSA1/START domain